MPLRFVGSRSVPCGCAALSFAADGVTGFGRFGLSPRGATVIGSFIGWFIPAQPLNATMTRAHPAAATLILFMFDSLGLSNVLSNRRAGGVGVDALRGGGHNPATSRARTRACACVTNAAGRRARDHE